VQKALIHHFRLHYHSLHYFEEQEIVMELVLVLVLVLGLALGWMLGLDSGRKSVRESEKAYWFRMVQDLESQLRLARAKEKARLQVESGHK
jgi:hypothetical protein